MAFLHKKFVERFEKFTGDHPFVHDHLKSLEDQLKIKQIYLAYGAVVLMSGWLVFGYGAALLCNMIGFLYPMYMSIKALETDDKDDDTQWLMYWVVFAFFSSTLLVFD